MFDELKDQVVIVTGGSSGIGAAVAREFAKYGSRVVICSRSNTTGGAEVEKSLRAQGMDALYIQADLSQPKDVSRFFATVRSDFGEIDVLINNAGSTKEMNERSSSAEHWVEMMNDNLLNTVLCTQEFLRDRDEDRSGAIVNTSSVRGVSNFGRSGVAAYAAAKAGVNSYTKIMASELAPAIRVNAVIPGLIWTPNWEGTTEEEKREWAAKTPLNRFIDPEEIATAYVFLAASPVITGQLLVVDGGYMLREP